jgi:hypothetical protein
MSTPLEDYALLSDLRTVPAPRHGFGGSTAPAAGVPCSRSPDPKAS